MSHKLNHKAMSSIVSVILLLVVMVVASFITFNFYKSLSSSYSADIEDQISLEKYIDFAYIESNTLYYSNSHKYDIEFDNLSLIGEDCSYSGILEIGSHNFSLSGCTISTTDLSIQILFRSNGIAYSEYVVFKDNY